MEKTLQPGSSQALIGTMWIVITAVLWSFIGLISKYCLEAGMPPLECALMRAFFGCLAFFVHCAVTGQLKIPLKHALGFILFGAWGIGVYFTCCQYTIKLSGAAMDIILQYTGPAPRFWPFSSLPAARSASVFPVAVSPVPCPLWVSLQAFCPACATPRIIPSHAGGSPRTLLRSSSPGWILAGVWYSPAFSG